MIYGQDQSIGLKQTTRTAVLCINREEKFLKVKGRISISTKRQIINWKHEKFSSHSFKGFVAGYRMHMQYLKTKQNSQSTP